jgi:plastocyanin
MRKTYGVGAALAVALAALIVTAIASAGPSSRQVQMLDNCDGPTFDAVVGPGTCIRNGGLTFDKFVARLIEQHEVDSWRFSPEHLSLDAGGTITAVNRGGEFHTFTPVAQFGGGCIQFLNDLLGGLTPVPECSIPDILEATGAVPGDSFTTAPQLAGTQRFMCLIHPWMRSTANVG